jgi:glutamate dehydrogenase (NAD(P)+)
MQKIDGPDGTGMTGFVLVDLDDASAADGVVRSAKKILVDGARTMARSRTYAWALLGEQVSGASAGISVSPDHREAGVAAFVDAVVERVRSGELSLDPGKGMTREDLAPFDPIDRRGQLRDARGQSGPLSAELLAASAVAAASAALGGLDGRRVALEGAAEALPALVAALGRAGASLVAVGTGTGAACEPGGLDPQKVLEAHREHGEGLTAVLGSDEAATVMTAEADVLMCGSRLGLVDHDVAGTLGHRLLVPIGPVPVTAKGLAVATRRGVVVLPDFLTTVGPLLAFRSPEDVTAEDLLVRADEVAAGITAELLDHPEGPLLAACLRAEGFLATWQDRLPFGRPLA